MDAVAVGFWGGYFGVAVVALLASGIPLVRGLPRVALLMAAAPLLNGAYCLAAVGWLPGTPELHLRLQGLIALHNSLALSALMLLMLRTRGWVWRAWLGSVALVVVVGLVSLQLDPRSGMLLGTGYATLCTWIALALLFSPRGLRHHRLAWLAVCSVGSVSLGLVLTSWIAAVAPAAPWQLHAVTASVVALHEVCMAFAVWGQFSHLAELRLVRAYGAGYDPVTRMRSVELAGSMINSVFSARGSGQVGALVIAVGNLHALEHLHGRAEHNQALFILSTRLRGVLPRGVMVGRLGPDVFLLLVRRARSMRELLSLARGVRERLAQPVTLGSGERPSELHLGAHQWVPELGIGVLHVPRAMNRAAAVNQARGMARSALAFPGRIACLGDDGREVVEAPVPPPRA